MQVIDGYVLNLQSRLEKVHENARLKLQKAAIKQQYWYNNRKKNRINFLLGHWCITIVQLKEMHQKRANINGKVHM